MLKIFSQAFVIYRAISIIHTTRTSVMIVRELGWVLERAIGPGICYWTSIPSSQALCYCTCGAVTFTGCWVSVFSLVTRRELETGSGSFYAAENLVPAVMCQSLIGVYKLFPLKKTSFHASSAVLWKVNLQFLHSFISVVWFLLTWSKRLC